MKLFRKITVCTLATSIMVTTPALSENYISLDQIFWPSPKYQTLNGMELVAYFEDGEFASYLLKLLDTGELFLLKPNEYFQVAQRRLILIGAEDGQLIFSSEDNQKFVLQMKASDVASIAVDETPEVSTLPVSRTPEEKVQFTQAKELARILGVPSILVNSFDVMPDFGVSRGGRKGLLLGDGVPKLFFTFTPFKRGDILLGVDGIPFTEVDKLLEHINVKGKDSRYAVELQRDNRLRLLNVYMK
jgi:hypothetical protein